MREILSTDVSAAWLNYDVQFLAPCLWGFSPTDGGWLYQRDDTSNEVWNKKDTLTVIGVDYIWAMRSAAPQGRRRMRPRGARSHGAPVFGQLDSPLPRCAGRLERRLLWTATRCVRPLLLWGCLS
jgi:hypothetical protein